MTRTVLLIDGGAPRSWAQRRGIRYDADLVDDLAQACVDPGEALLRVLYYDCEPYEGTEYLPVSRAPYAFRARGSLLDDIAKRERFAVRRGELAFRGWQLRSYDVAGVSLTDEHFKPRFEQKGVDMRIGLDIANFAERRSVDRLLLVAVDNDMVPAMKYARRAGLEVGIVELPPPSWLTDGLRAHADFVRVTRWHDEAPAEGHRDDGDDDFARD